MRIETDEWTTLADVVAATGMAQKTLYRIVDRLGIGVCFFGVRCVKKDDVSRIVNSKLPAGNPRWINSTEEAANAAALSVASRLRRVAKSGVTTAEKRRNKRLAAIGKTLGGRKPKGDG